MRTPLAWLRDLVRDAVRVELNEEFDNETFKERIESIEEGIAGAEKLMAEKVDAAIGRVGTLVQNEMGKIVWGHVQRHERDEFINVRSDLEHLNGKIEELRERLSAEERRGISRDALNEGLRNLIAPFSSHRAHGTTCSGC